MSSWLYLARFFLVVPPMPLLMVGAFAVTTCIAAIVIVVEPARAAGALTPVLLLQLFACSSGFDVPARRGHYDILLTHGATRRRIVIGHWAASALPGLCCWLLLGGLHLLTANESRTSLFSPGTLFAVVTVSTIPWAITVRLPRFSGAIGWLLIVVTQLFALPDMLSVDVSSRIGNWTSWLQQAWAVLMYPVLLVGQDLGADDALIVLPGLLFVLAAMGAAFWSVNRRDIPLEAAQ